MRRAGFLALLVCCAFASAAQGAIVVDFDDAGKWTAGSGGITSYQTNHVYSDQGLVFTGGPALRNGNAVQDGFAGALGTFSWRLRDAATVSFTATYADTSVAGGQVSGFGFDVRRWDGAPSPAYSIAYSTNGGADFTLVDTIDNDFLGNTSNWFSFSHSFSTVNVADGDFIVRLSATGGERIMFDNFSLAVTAVPEPTSLAVLGIAAGVVAVRRRMRRV